MTLLDTNALLWLEGNDRRAAPLTGAGRLYISPVSLLEIQFLIEVGRISLVGAGVNDLSTDSRWLLDDPPSARLFRAALGVSWTRDPFDRLLVAHATLRGWRLATGDRALLRNLGSDKALEL